MWIWKKAVWSGYSPASALQRSRREVQKDWITRKALNMLSEDKPIFLIAMLKDGKDGWDRPFSLQSTPTLPVGYILGCLLVAFSLLLFLGQAYPPLQKIVLDTAAISCETIYHSWRVYFSTWIQIMHSTGTRLAWSRTRQYRELRLAL